MNENLIYERMKSLGNDANRELYRDMSRVFSEIVEYNQKKLNDLVERIKNEDREKTERFTIYNTVAANSDTVIENDFLFSMEDNRKPLGCLATIFCECNSSMIKQLTQVPQKIIIKTEQRIKRINARLVPCKRYYELVDDFKKSLLESGKGDIHLNLPYLSHFFDILGEETEEPIVQVLFEDHDIECHSDFIPLWNVENVVSQCSIFPIPMVDEENYEHSLTLVKKEDGYLVKNSKQVKEIRYDKNGISIITQEKVACNFELYHIAKKRSVTMPHYPICSNKRAISQIERFAVQKRYTNAEVYRALSSFECSNTIHFQGVSDEIEGNILPLKEKFYPFLKQKVTFLFKVDEHTMTTEDEISFLLLVASEYMIGYSLTGKII